MIEPSILVKQLSSEQSDATTSRLRQEYRLYKKMFLSQPVEVQQHLKSQAASLAKALLERHTYAHFLLPDHITCKMLLDCDGESELIPAESRQQKVGGMAILLGWTDLHVALSQRLSKLEQSDNLAISVSAGLVRYALVVDMIYQVLPAGKSVKYGSLDSDDVPNIPVESDYMHERVATVQANNYRAKTQVIDTIGEVQEPYVKAAQRFFMPQWVAFDEQGNLLTGNLVEAESYIASMQRYLYILNLAVAMAPYMIADEICQQKRYGMMGQLVNQGRALARCQLQEIINTVNRRSMNHALDRGLSISLPYFNDQTLSMEIYNLEVIPAGRVMFIPAFLVLAVRMHAIKIAQDIHLSRQTRKQLLVELSILERTFLRQ